ncbi:efflux RND transporter permease subunit [Lignipirellula cremea]|uniref:Membrane protein YdgH n=1 Tax=Lignipirellula cremea TaxID=2528010 RepID=A0A518DZC4_9BACT|nr:MMPL family transporter [Lignipirellula cremea]QDU97200.1 Putative membrane protein YdgH [Lignipirellula cremea]
MKTWSRSLVDFLIRWRYALFITALAIGAAAIGPASRLGFDRSIENMFAPSDPLLPPYSRLKARFGGNEIVMAVYRDEMLFNPTGEGVVRVGEVADELRKVPGVRDVLSVAQIDSLLRTPLFFGTTAVANSRLAKNYRYVFEAYTHSGDGRTAAVVCMLIPEQETDAPRRETIDQLRTIISRQPHGMLAGEPVMVVDGFRYVEEDGARMGLFTTILLGLVILLCFRSLRWLAIPLLVVQFTLLLTKAVLVLSGLRLSMVSSMLTAIVTVVGVAAVVHVVVRFREARSEGLSQKEALAQAGTILAGAIFWSCMTDAAGFLALTFADVGPIHDFGLMMAIGSVLVLVSAACVIPTLALLGSWDADPRRAWGEGVIDFGLDRLVDWTVKHPFVLGIGTLLLLALSVVGLLRQQIETDFTRNFRQGSPIVQAYQDIEKEFGGAGVWDIMLPAPASIDSVYLNRVLELENDLRAIELPAGEPGAAPARLTKVISLADVDEAAKASRMMRIAGPEARATGMKGALPAFFSALRSSDVDDQGNTWLRIMLRAKERESASQKLRLIAAVEEVTAKHFPPQDTPQTSAEVTGFYILLTNLIQSIVSDQWTTFGYATLGIFLMMTLAFRNPLQALLALVPNALPILLVLGGMGLLQYKLNMGAAMIAAVSMGLSVDSSIHYILSFQHARRNGLSVEASLRDVQQSVGRAMVFSTLALIAGFSVLCVSNFVPTIYFGALVSLSMLGGLLGNLLVLPLLLRLCTRENREEDLPQSSERNTKEE